MRQWKCGHNRGVSGVPSFWAAQTEKVPQGRKHTYVYGLTAPTAPEAPPEAFLLLFVFDLCFFVCDLAKNVDNLMKEMQWK
jgi:hypothetical protein